MRAVLQRVKQAAVTIDGQISGSINQGILILLGVHKEDSEQQADFLVTKCTDLRIFNDPEGKMNLSLKDVKGEALVVSQFTLYGDCRKGRRPSFTQAAPPAKGERLYEYFVKKLKTQLKNVQTGVFGVMMEVSLVNDGPVTIILER